MSRTGSARATTIDLLVDQSVLVPELETDWSPDPWRWSHLPDPLALEDAYENAALESVTWLKVPFPRGRPRVVPVLAPWTRALHTSVANLLAAGAEGTLHDGVFGFRSDGKGALESYRSALVRRGEYARHQIAAFGHALTADVRTFFRSIGSAGLTQHVVAREVEPVQELAEATLGLITAQVGYPVPEGYNASRAIASLLLRPVDEAIDLPFSRWIDDYKIFSTNPLVLLETLLLLESALALIDLELNSEKSRVTASNEIDINYVGSLDCSHHEIEAIKRLPDLLAGSLPEEKQVRYLFRIAAEHFDNDVLDLIGDNALRIPDIALPRIAWVIGSHPDHPGSARLLDRLLDLETEYAEWRFLRLSYALWYTPTSAIRDLVPRLLVAAERFPTTRGVIARVLARHQPEAIRSRFLAEQFSTRERELILKEARGADMHGPPLRSYL